MAIAQVEENFIDIVTGKSRKIIMEVNLKDAPVPNLYQFQAYLKLVYED